MWWYVPSIFANGFYGLKKKEEEEEKKKKNNFVSCSSIQKHVFKSVELEEKTSRVSSCASNHDSKRRYQPWLYCI